MKIVLIILALIIISGCANQTAAINNKNKAVNNIIQPSPTVNNTNANTFVPIPRETSEIDEAERIRLEKLNETFRSVPDEFKKVDFENFSYPYKFSYNQRKLSISLKKGGNYVYDFEYDRGWFDFYDVFFVDLTGDDKKEAIAMLWHISCGASCDGGSGLFYVYSIQNSKPNLLWQLKQEVSITVRV